MKRKKQVEESDNDHDHEPDQKRTRSGTIRSLSTKEEDGRDELGSSRPERGPSQRRKDSVQNGVGASISEETSNGDEEDEDDELPEASAESEKDTEDHTNSITPIKRANGNLQNSAKKAQVNGATPRKGMQGKKLFATPVKTNISSDTTPKLERHVDRSARRKSTRNLIERTVLGNTSDNDEEEAHIAQHIYGSGEEEEEEEVDLEQDESEDDREPKSGPDTPSKKRGRQKRKPSPPAVDLAPHELYFFQNRGGRSKTSNNNLSSLALLDHEEYFTLLRSLKDPHADDIEWLQELHSGSFNQWQFELSQNFNICVFGWGSKRSLLMKFAEHIYESQMDHPKNKIVIVNGYVQNLTIRDVLNTVGAAISEGRKLGSQPAEMLENLLALLEEEKSRRVTVVVHSIDRAPLRRHAAQTILSRLSSHPQIYFVASADHPSFPLLWDSSLRSTFNFLFHDCTTFQPYTSELDVVDEVHELLGRSGRRVGGKEGVSFVLKSLPENAKNLFRILIGEQLATMDNSSGAGFVRGDYDGDDDDNEGRTGNSGRGETGVEYRVLFQKAVEEFICSNEMNFRTLLKEFHDHQMIQSRKDALGTEMLSVPFRKEELETILEDITS